MISAGAGCKREVLIAPAEPKVAVIASSYALAEAARQVGGDAIQASWVMEDGQPPDDFHITQDVREKLNRADIVISAGATEPWAIEGFDDPSHSQRFVRLDLVAPDASLVPAARQLWLDPIVVRQSLDSIVQKLTVQAPSQGNLFAKNARDFSDRIDGLMREFDSRINAIVGMKVLVLSHDFSAMDVRLKLVEISPVQTSPLRLGESDFAALQQAAESQHPAAMLVDINTPQTVQHDLASRLGVPVIAIDALGSSAGRGHNTYVGMMRYDLEQLTAMGQQQK